MTEPEPSDTSPEVAALQRQIHARMGGFGRMRVAAEAFARWRAMLEAKYGDPMLILRHMHGDSISESDYQRIAELMRR